MKFCERPFSHKDEMDHALISNWNRVVSHSDTIYCLGDLFFCNRGRAIEISLQLNGQKFWLFGNHDKKPRKWKDVVDLWVWTGDYKEIRIPDPTAQYDRGTYQKIDMMHYPIGSWNGMHHNAWMLHGHSHSTYNMDSNKILDVGCDTWDYTPVSYERVKEYMATRPFVPVDGHGLRKQIQH